MRSVLKSKFKQVRVSGMACQNHKWHVKACKSQVREHIGEEPGLHDREYPEWLIKESIRFSTTFNRLQSVTAEIVAKIPTTLKVKIERIFRDISKSGFSRLP